MSISIIMPTSGRVSLKRAVDSVVHQLHDDDEVIIVGDGMCAEARDLYGKAPPVSVTPTAVPPLGRQLAGFESVVSPSPAPVPVPKPSPIKYFECWRPGSRFGIAQRDYGISMATGQWLAFLDDDDIYTRDALALMHAALPETPDNPHIFRMQYNVRVGKKLWDSQTFRVCNIGTPMIVVPRRPDLPKWFRTDTKLCFDWSWIRGIVRDLYTVERIVWHKEVTCIVRPTEDCAKAEIPVKE